MDIFFFMHAGVKKGDEMSSTITSRKTRYPKSDLKNQHLTPHPPEKGRRPTGQSKLGIWMQQSLSPSISN